MALTTLAAAAAKAGAVILVEGYIDALAMDQAGITNTVGLMGTAVSEQQIAALKRLAPTVVLMLDGDDAGAQAVLRAGELARPAGLEIHVASLPAGSDPAALVQQDGVEAVRTLAASGRALARFQVRYHVERGDLSNAEGKDRLVGELRDVFADVPSSAVREDLIALVANHLAALRPTSPPRHRHCPDRAATLGSPESLRRDRPAGALTGIGIVR